MQLAVPAVPLAGRWRLVDLRRHTAHRCHGARAVGHGLMERWLRSRPGYGVTYPVHLRVYSGCLQPCTHGAPAGRRKADTLNGRMVSAGWQDKTCLRTGVAGATYGGCHFANIYKYNCRIKTSKQA